MKLLRSLSSGMEDGLPILIPGASSIPVLWAEVTAPSHMSYSPLLEKLFTWSHSIGRSSGLYKLSFHWLS